MARCLMTHSYNFSFNLTFPILNTAAEISYVYHIKTTRWHADSVAYSRLGLINAVIQLYSVSAIESGTRNGIIQQRRSYSHFSYSSSMNPSQLYLVHWRNKQNC
jgi:hypothetical protein